MIDNLLLSNKISNLEHMFDITILNKWISDKKSIVDRQNENVHDDE